MRIMSNEPTVYDSDWCARELDSRKEILTLVVCWLIIAPALPIGLLWLMSNWLANRPSPPWCSWLAEKADEFADRNGVRFS
jgi:hypothetical protein